MECVYCIHIVAGTYSRVAIVYNIYLVLGHHRIRIVASFRHS